MPIPKLNEKNINMNNRSCLAEVYQAPCSPSSHCVFLSAYLLHFGEKMQPKTMSIAAEILPGGCYYQVKPHLCRAKSKRRVVTG